MIARFLRTLRPHFWARGGALVRSAAKEQDRCDSAAPFLDDVAPDAEAMFIGAAWDALTAILAGIVLLGSLLAMAI